MNFWKKSLCKSDYIFVAVILLIAIVFGNILHDVILALTAQSDLASGEEVTTFPLGSLLGVIALAVVMLLSIFKLLTARFDMVIGMGGTRKEFFCNELANQGVSIGLGLVIIWVCSKLEQLKLKLVYPQYRCELDFADIFNWKTLIPAIIMALGFTFIMSAIFLKFRRKAIIVYWVVYMAFMLGLSQMSRITDVMLPLLAGSTIPWGLILPIAFSVVGAALLLVSWLLICRQDVRV